MSIDAKTMHLLKQIANRIYGSDHDVDRLVDDVQDMVLVHLGYPNPERTADGTLQKQEERP